MSLHTSTIYIMHVPETKYSYQHTIVSHCIMKCVSKVYIIAMEIKLFDQTLNGTNITVETMHVPEIK